MRQRKPLRPTEHTSRQEEFLRALQQIRHVKSFLASKPRYLHDVGNASKGLGDYKKVYYGIIARDYFVWLDPTDVPVIDYDSFVSRIGGSIALSSAMDELLTFSWLPVEGRDFTINYDRRSVNGVAVETAVHYPIS
jgi:hypothetical protein